jgi:molybdenum-dependent DNA-binding transcriptional regulator ModE
MKTAFKGSMQLPGWESTQGSKHRNAKLDEAKVRLIRKTWDRGALEKLAKQCGISYRTAVEVRAKRRWAHVKDQVSE